MDEGHPENFRHSQLDSLNRARPEPQSFDELAASPDPLEVERRNRASTRQAIVFAVATVLLTLLIGFLLAAIARGIGGPLCDAGEATWLCSRSSRLWWAVLSSLAPVGGLLGCAVIMVRKLNRYERWAPWMGVFWIPLVPFTMWWLTITVGIIAVDTPTV